MTQRELNNLRAYYHSLLGQHAAIEEVASRAQWHIGKQHFAVVAEEIGRIEADFPGLLPLFSPANFLSPDQFGREAFDLYAVRSYLSTALGRLKVAIERPEGTPLIEAKEFPFVCDQELRKLLERDYAELQRACVANCWKSLIILAAGAIEALLTDCLLQSEEAARTATTAPKKSDIRQWDLADLIRVAVELKKVSGGVEKLSHSVREYRNLVHPGNELRYKLKFDAEEARIAVEVLRIVDRDLAGNAG